MHLTVKLITVNLSEEHLFDLPRRSAEFDLAAAIGDLVNVQAARFEPFHDDVHVFSVIGTHEITIGTNSLQSLSLCLGEGRSFEPPLQFDSTKWQFSVPSYSG